MVRFHSTLSDRSVYFRYFQMLNYKDRVSHERLTRICFIDYSREMALVAVDQGNGKGEGEIVGVGRLTRPMGGRIPEFALLVSDTHQRFGVGRLLLDGLLNFARREAIPEITGQILPDNAAMLGLAKKLGFNLQYSVEERAVIATLTTGIAPSAP